MTFSFLAPFVQSHLVACSNSLHCKNGNFPTTLILSATHAHFSILSYTYPKKEENIIELLIYKWHQIKIKVHIWKWILRGRTRWTCLKFTRVALASTIRSTFPYFLSSMIRPTESDLIPIFTQTFTSFIEILYVITSTYILFQSVTSTPTASMLCDIECSTAPSIFAYTSIRFVPYLKIFLFYL